MQKFQSEFKQEVIDELDTFADVLSDASLLFLYHHVKQQKQCFKQ